MTASLHQPLRYITWYITDVSRNSEPWQHRSTSLWDISLDVSLMSLGASEPWQPHSSRGWNTSLYISLMSLVTHEPWQNHFTRLWKLSLYTSLMYLGTPERWPFKTFLREKIALFLELIWPMLGPKQLCPLRLYLCQYILTVNSNYGTLFVSIQAFCWMLLLCCISVGRVLLWTITMRQSMTWYSHTVNFHYETLSVLI